MFQPFACLTLHRRDRKEALMELQAREIFSLFSNEKNWTGLKTLSFESHLGLRLALSVLPVVMLQIRT